MINDKISPKLWKAIKDNYERESYTSAIYNTMIYLNEVLQEKSGLDGLDNVKLVENVFSEKKPKILITPCKTDSEKNIQKGVGFILRGMFYAIRHPRAHERYNDSKETADIIIMFADYILRFLEDHESPELYEDWVDFILDENFNSSQKNAHDTFNSIPIKKRHDVLIGLCRNRSMITNENSIKHILSLLYDDLSKDQFSELIDSFNRDLKKCIADDNLKNFFLIFPPEKWGELNLLVRNRIEGMVLKSINNAKVIIEEVAYEQFVVADYNDESKLAIWSKGFIQMFSNKDEILNCILSKITYKEDFEEEEFININYIDVLKCYKEKDVLSSLDSYLSLIGLETNSRLYKILSKIIRAEELEKYITKLEINEDMPF